MLRSLKCRLKGHLYVDSRSQAGTQVCIRCKHRRPFENFTAAAPGVDNPSPEESSPVQGVSRTSERPRLTSAQAAVPNLIGSD